MSSNRRFKSSLELSTSASGSPLIARPDAVVGTSTQTSIGHSQKHLLKKFAPTFERYQPIRHSFNPRPRAGATGQAITATAYMLFQSTPPRGGDKEVETMTGHIPSFNPRPRAGATGRTDR